MTSVYVELEGCDNRTEFSLVCTEEQLEFLREFAKMTKEVSDCSCMPIINLYQGETGLLDKDTPLKAVMSKDEGESSFDDASYELNTTKLNQL